MADDDETPDEETPDPAIRQRRDAESAAGDLARMGIDPRSLGLGETSRPVPPAGRSDDDGPDDEESHAPVVPLRPEFTQQRPVAPDDERAEATGPIEPAPLSTAEQLLARTAARAPAPPRPPSRWWPGLANSVGKGLATPDAAVAVQGERDVVEGVRQRQGDRRIVAFIAGKGGIGCTSVAIGVGTAFMAMRDDSSVVVDLQQGTPSLGTAFGAADPRSVTSLLAETEVTAPPRNAAGLGLVDGADWDLGLTRGDVAGVLDRLGADHTFNLLDVGDDPGEGGHAALARADQVVVVSGPGELGFAAMQAALERVRHVNPAALARTVHVVVCPHEVSHREAHRQIVEQLAVTPAAVVVVPPDRHLQAGHAYDPALVAPATREALLRVAAAVALAAVHR